MGVFDFITKNAKDLAGLDIDDDGGITVPVADFDFGHAGVDVESVHDGLKFKVSVSPFELVTTVCKEDLQDAVASLSRVSDADMRKKIIEVLEQEFRDESEAERTDAEEALLDAKTVFDEADKAHKDLVDGMRVLKSNWGLI